MFYVILHLPFFLRCVHTSTCSYYLYCCITVLSCPALFLAELNISFLIYL